MMTVRLQHCVSQLLGWLANWSHPRWLIWLAIVVYKRIYRIELTDTQHSSVKQFKSFNDFFTRKLKENARPLPADPTLIVSPVDGTISQIGAISEQTIVQAKGHHFSLLDLLGQDQALSTTLHNGSFLTAYLSPRDYHCIHMPIDGTLLSMCHIPGSLFPVHQQSVENTAGLFARNERVICVFDTALGTLAMILVGAFIVGSIATRWHGTVTPPHHKLVSQWDYRQQPVRLQRGQLMGHFNLGSTVILVFPQQALQWQSDLAAMQALRLGQTIASPL